MDYVLELLYSPEDARLAEAVETVTFLSDSVGAHITSSGRGEKALLFFENARCRAAAIAMVSGTKGLAWRELDIPSTDWLEHYEQSLVPIAIGRRFVVAPVAELLPDDDARIALVIPQQRAFGTGSHETTSLCLEHLEDVDLTGRIGLDVGTGSGILAIAMIRLGAQRVIAVDNDPEVVDVIPGNLARNGIEGNRIGVIVGTCDAIRRRSRFDVIVMNILPEVIVPLLPFASALLNEGGELISSGVLLDRAGEVRRAAEANGLRFVGELTRGEWWAGRFAASRS